MSAAAGARPGGRRGTLAWGAVLALGVALAWALRGVVAAEAARAVAGDEAPFAWPSPLAALSLAAGVFLWWAPGLALVRALGRARTAAEWLALGFLAATVAHAVAFTVAKLALGTPCGAGTLRAVMTGEVALAFALEAWRGRRSPAPATDADRRADRRSLLAAGALLVAAAFLLLPKILVENLNDDGAEALYIALSLDRFLLPRFPTDVGLVGVGVGMVSQAFVGHEFAAWFGAGDFVPRVPFLVALPAVLAGVVALVELPVGEGAGSAQGSGARRASGGLLAVLAAGLGVYALVMAFSAGYDPYVCELSSPAAFDTLLLAWFLVGALALLRGSVAAFLACVLLAHLARPTGLLLFVLLGVAGALALRGAARRGLLWIGAGVALCLLVSSLHETLYAPRVLGGKELPYAAGSILERFYFVTLTDVRRLAFLVVPAGILPALTLVLWRRQDPLARTFTLTTLAYFALFYVPAFVSLHHFVPAMVLPLVVFGRLARTGALGSGRRVLALAVPGLLLAAGLAWPQRLAPDRTLRRLGARIADARPPRPFVASGPGAEGPGEDGVRARQRALDVLVPIEEPGVDPAVTYVGSSFSLARYARRGLPDERTLWLLQPADRARPPGWTVVSERAGDVLLARAGASPERLANDPPRPPPTGFAAPLLAIPREVLFPHLGIPAGRYDLSPRKLLLGW